jgi:hypothetical protein
MRRFSIGFPLAVGVSIIAWWAFVFATGQVPELQGAPVQLAFHVVAELLTAGMLIAGGIGLLRHRPWGRAVDLVGLGMLLYTAVGSPGYFAQNGQWPLVGVFAVVAAGTLVALVAAVRANDA